jgi:1,4-alpha-glucan branching enzyme
MSVAVGRALASSGPGMSERHGKGWVAGQASALAQGRCEDPFAVLGPHLRGDGRWDVRVFAPGAIAVHLVDALGEQVLARARRLDAEGLFCAILAARIAYRVRIEWPGGVELAHDPYAFGPLLDEGALGAIAAGDGEALRHALGAWHACVEGVRGVRFAVWAPNARRVSVVGDFNGWRGTRHPMRRRHAAGVWEIFLPGVAAGARYKYEIVAASGVVLPHKADPCARQAELPPATASRVPAAQAFEWHDQDWMRQRESREPRPVSIYEVHAASWMRDTEGAPLDWDALGARLIPYVVEHGFTHIELLPITEHPFGGSWGYQPLGMYAPTARLGAPDAFARFVDACHGTGIGVILDWVSAHFPDDEHGLQRFDGTALYEHEDPREGLHQDWDTLIYNYGRREVSAYLVGSALEWLDRFHVDGLRVDAVASMLYRDYSRSEGEWVPNAEGGRENLEAVAFLRELNRAVDARCPGALVIAEESTAWPGVTAATDRGGLGFGMKWNLGWMHDTLAYMQRDPVHRRYHHSEMTFGLVYAFSERYVLALSHDEVVHGKGSLLSKMPGNGDEQFANLRAYYGFMWGHPGAKLLFMGGEFGQRAEWDHDRALDWNLLGHDAHAGVQRMVADLNRLLRRQPALYRNDHEPRGFAWSVGDDSDNSVLAFVRCGEAGEAPVLVVSNFTPLVRRDYRVGVPLAGAWREIFNSDSAWYGGGNVGNLGVVDSVPEGSHGFAQSLSLSLPPLATIWLRAGEA